MDITIEMNLSESVIARAGYNLLDYLSAIGGMQAMLMSCVAYFLAIWNYNSFENFMVTRLFRMRKKNAEKIENPWKRSSYVKPGFFANITDYICAWVPTLLRSCKCCNWNRKATYFEKARVQLENEINIIDIIKSRRYFAMALKVLLTKE